MALRQRGNTSWSGWHQSFPPATRARILKRDPVCVICHTKPSTAADHTPNYATLVRMRVQNPHAEQYGQGVCDECHAVKTTREAAEGRARLKPKRAVVHPSDTTC